jgi:DNA-binding transcriptional LysR family regulator
MYMPNPTGIDPDLLRSFTAIAEEASFTRAAARVGRTQSAVSMQMQRLEALLGQRLLIRAKGGAVQLTPQGGILLDRARELLALNDRIWTSFHGPKMEGTVRLGSPDDYALRYLPPILRRFADSHPAVEVEVECLPSNELVEKLREGALDLSLISKGNEPRRWPTEQLLHGQLHWITSERYAPHRQDPLPLATAHSDIWGNAAQEALDKAGRRWRIAYSSGSQVGTHAPVLAGLAVTISTMSWVPEGLRVVRPEEGLPKLGDFAILLMKSRAARQPVTDALANLIKDAFAQETRRAGRPTSR